MPNQDDVDVGDIAIGAVVQGGYSEGTLNTENG